LISAANSDSALLSPAVDVVQLVNALTEGREASTETSPDTAKSTAISIADLLRRFMQRG